MAGLAGFRTIDRDAAKKIFRSYPEMDTVENVSLTLSDNKIHEIMGDSDVMYIPRKFSKEDVGYFFWNGNVLVSVTRDGQDTRTNADWVVRLHTGSDVISASNAFERLVKTLEDEIGQETPSGGRKS